MGWAASDEAKRDNLKVLTSNTRQAAYHLRTKIDSLKKELAHIVHDEKRVALQNALEQAEAFFLKGYEQLYEVDTHLNR